MKRGIFSLVLAFTMLLTLFAGVMPQARAEDEDTIAYVEHSHEFDEAEVRIEPIPEDYVFISMEPDEINASVAYTTSTAYKNSIYYTKLIDVPITGDYRTDLVNVALSQVGYHEGDSSADLGGGNDSGSENYTEYAYWRGLQGNPWCAMFIGWCAVQAGIPQTILNNRGTYATTNDMGVEWHLNDGDYTPKKGDLFIWDSTGRTPSPDRGEHIGIVTGVDSGYVYTVEGNSDNQVGEHSYSRSNSNIVGYGEMNTGVELQSTADDFNKKLEQFQKDTKYTEGSHYKDDSGYGGYECFGFANRVASYFFGSYPTGYQSARILADTNWTITRGSAAVDNICIGDIFCYGLTNSNSNHSLFITGVDGDTIYYCDANSDWHNTIHYNRTKTRSELKIYIDRWLNLNAGADPYRGWIAHYNYSPYSVGRPTHTHSYTVSGYEAAHPHKEYKKCSCGEFYYTGNTRYISSCTICNPNVGSCSCATSYAGQYIVSTASYPLTIRSGHGTSYSAVGSIPKGAEVTVTKANGTWAHVSYNGISGCVSMQYLSRKPDTTPYNQILKDCTPINCYPLSTDHHAADAWSDINRTNHIGYIYGDTNGVGDFVTIKAIYDNGMCLVDTPWDNSRRDVYAWTSCFLNANGSTTPKDIVIEKYADTYIRLGSSTKLGWIDPGDKAVIVDDTYSTRKQIIYPNSGGTHSCAWVDAAALVHTHTPGSAATCTSPQVCTTCDAVLAAALGHNPGAAATCTAAQTCTRCGIVINAAHGHSYGEALYYEDTHPHAVYQKCSVCGDKKYNGEYATVPDCPSCPNPPIITNFVASDTTISVGTKVTFTVTATNAVQYNYCIRDESGNMISESAQTTSKNYYYTLNDPGKYTAWANAYNEYGSVSSDPVDVTVIQPVTGIELDREHATIKPGETTKLNVTFIPANASNKALAWSSHNTSIATVDNGIVTGVGIGSTAITARSIDGDHIAQCIVTVGEYYTVTYNANGGSGAPAAQTKTQGEALTLSTVRPIREGYTFLGWAESADATAAQYQPGGSFTKDANTTLYAVWIKTTDASFKIDNVSCRAGETVDVTISLENNPGITALNLDISFGEMLTLVDVEFNQEMGGQFQPPQTMKSPVTVAWFNGTSDFTVQNIVFVTLKFKVSEDAKEGDIAEITLSYDPSNVFNIKEEDIPFAVINGSVTILVCIPGDINGDGTTNMKDLTRLFQYLANWDVDVNTPALDVNGDGSINMKDLTRLFQYLANWDVEIFPK